MSALKALKRAVKLAGGQTALADKCAKVSGRKCDQGNVWSWLNRSKRVADEWAIPVEMALKGMPDAPTRHELRPDLYPTEESLAA